MEIVNKDGLEYLSTFEDNSIDLILTDPPYITSRDTGMNTFYDNIKNDNTSRTEQDWEKYVEKNPKPIQTKAQRDNFLKYGTIYGKKYAVQTQYGNWDSEFTLEKLEDFVRLFFLKLRNGGTCIIFFDIWKITTLKDIMEKYGFKQIRFIEWIETNPQPLNSQTNYLTNCREIALVGIKKSKPTFNSKYDKGVYNFPIQGGKNRVHPTQKNLDLFKELVKKHSNEGDLVVDTFLGSGTTALACKHLNRKFSGCELDEKYYTTVLEIMKNN